jgi:hypothetical protein
MELENVFITFIKNNKCRISKFNIKNKFNLIILKPLTNYEVNINEIFTELDENFRNNVIKINFRNTTFSIKNMINVNYSELFVNLEDLYLYDIGRISCETLDFMFNNKFKLHMNYFKTNLQNIFNLYKKYQNEPEINKGEIFRAGLNDINFDDFNLYNICYNDEYYYFEFKNIFDLIRLLFSEIPKSDNYNEILITNKYNITYKIHID